VSRSPGKFALLAALVSVAITAYLLSVPGAPTYAGRGGSPVQDAIDRLPIDSETQAQVRALQPLLAGIGAPRADPAAPLALAMLGYKEIVPPEVEPAPPPAPQPPPAPASYVVSMTYVSADRRFAVIDGRFYREGGRLTGGERIVSIEPGAVRIQGADAVRSLDLETELESGLETFSRQGGVIDSDTTGSDAADEAPAPTPATS